MDDVRDAANRFWHDHPDISGAYHSVQKRYIEGALSRAGLGYKSQSEVAAVGQAFVEDVGASFNDGRTFDSFAGGAVRWLFSAPCTPPPQMPLTGRPHGESAHDAAIDDRIGILPKNAGNARKHQAQVNAKGEKVSDFKPDAQWTDPKSELRHYYEASSKTSKADPKRLRQHDPDAIIEVENLDTGIIDIYLPGQPIP